MHCKIVLHSLKSSSDRESATSFREGFDFISASYTHLILSRSMPTGFLKVIHESKDCECCTRKFFYAFRYISKRPLFRCLWANQAMLYCKAVDKIALEFVGFPSALITLHTFKFKSLTFRSDPLRALLKYCMILECIDKKWVEKVLLFPQNHLTFPSSANNKPLIMMDTTLTAIS